MGRDGLSLRVCKCGCEFESKHSTQIYCSPECLSNYKTINRQNKIADDYQYRCKRILSSASFRASKLNVPFNIDLEYLINQWLIQDGRCAISGRIFDTRTPEKFRESRKDAPSLDRIKPNKGYTKGNIRFVCYQVNTALHSFGEEALISLCKDIVEFNKGIIL